MRSRCGCSRKPVGLGARRLRLGGQDPHALAGGRSLGSRCHRHSGRTAGLRDPEDPYWKRWVSIVSSFNGPDTSDLGLIAETTLASMNRRSKMIDRRPFESLGGANHGWLDAKHHFSFADYHDPERMGWGSLRVWNDDTIA